MNESDWHRVEALFVQACTMGLEARRAFLDAQCGNQPELRRELETLLTAEDTEGDPLRSIVEQAAVAVQTDQAAEAVGQRIGAFVVDREIGQGGMGTVYLAHRADEHFEQRVAIKVVNRGMDSSFALTHFRRERQMLAGLQHPNIARLLDGGATADGLPFFAMEYLEGCSLTDYCSRHHLSSRARVELFLDICRAVEYAHSRLVIHRDLKPGNILVTEDGAPKLLDFGIATLVDSHRDEERAPSPITPRYSSPEQVAGQAVTTATDIYSLGAILEELLETAPGAHTRDLDAVTKQAMASDPAQRYPSAGHMAEDLRRWLAGRAVQAYSGGLRYRTGRFVGRHRLAVAAAALVLAAAAFGAWQYVRQAQLAQRRFQDLHGLANAFVFEVDDRLRALPGSTLARQLIVQKALEYLGNLAKESGGNQNLEHEVANAYRKVGDAQGDTMHSSLGDTAAARASYAKSIAILTGLRPTLAVRRDLVLSYYQAASLERVAGSSTQVAALLNRALPAAESAAAGKSEEDLVQLAAVHELFGRALQTTGNFPASVEHLRQAIGILERLPATPAHREALSSAYVAMANGLTRMGQPAEALVLYQSNLRVHLAAAAENPTDRDPQRQLMFAYSHVADLLGSPTHANIGDTQGALEAYRHVTEIAHGLAATDVSDSKAQFDVSMAELRLGNALMAAHQGPEALAHLGTALRITEQLEVRDPHNSRILNDDGFLHWRMAGQLVALERTDEARVHYAQSTTGYRRAIQEDRSNVDTMAGMLRMSLEYAALLARLGDRAAALSVAESIPALAQETSPAGAPIRARAERPHAWTQLGDLYQTLGDTTAAANWRSKGVAAWKELQATGTLTGPEAHEAEQTIQKYGH